MKMPTWLSSALRLHWMGWTTDTATLGRNGWQVSVQAGADHEDMVRIAIKQPEANAFGVCRFFGGMFSRFMRAGDSPLISPRSLDVDIGMQLGNRIFVQDFVGLPSWHPIDPEPALVDFDYRDLNELAMFRRLPVEERQIIVPEFSFDQILDMALEHQAPKQKELREKYRRQMQKADPGALIHVAA